MSRGRLIRLGVVAAAALGVAAVTALVFFIDAGGTGLVNWPENFDLGESDNGVLFQFIQDVAHGRAINWTFSPQVFVFPEIPISVLSYLIAGGAVRVYYLIVAMINNLLMFLAFFAVIRAIYQDESFRSRLVRALVTTAPMVVLTLFSTVSLFAFQLAPTYYNGMYLAMICAPLLFVVRRRAVLIGMAVVIALIVASNPLTLIFTIPVALCIGVVRRVRLGLGAVARPLVVTIIVIALAAAIRLAFFSGLQGTSPLTYLDASRVPIRIKTLTDNWAFAAQSGVTVVLLVVGLALGIVLFVMAVRHVARVLRKREVLDSRGWVLLYFGLIPIVGLLTTAGLLILNYLYLWPILIAPFSFVLLSVPAPRLRMVGLATAAVSVIALVASLIVIAPTGPATYLSYRSAETQCLDSGLPPGMDVGYAGYFDARRLELTSNRHLLLIQVDYQGTAPYDWLTNEDYATHYLGHFFFVDATGGELTTAPYNITSVIGSPDKTVTCSDGSQILIYTNAIKVQKITIRYYTPPLKYTGP